jgi:hypothetical protein
MTPLAPRPEHKIEGPRLPWSNSSFGQDSARAL